MSKLQPLNEKELNYLSDTDFLLTKRKLIGQLQVLLTLAQEQLQALIREQGPPLPAGCLQRAGKISRGENYRGLPYLVLDYPRLLAKEDIFSFRTLFWWGHFFSCTLHLQGKSLRQYRQQLKITLSQAGTLPDDSWICVNHTPWEYHYGPDNYRLISDLPTEELENILEKDFIKVSRKIPLQAYEQLPAFACESLESFLHCLQVQP